MTIPDADLTHVGPQEAAAAADPNIGDGTPGTAPDLPADSWQGFSLKPSRKWFAALVVGLTGLATMWATTGAWDQEETIAAITLVSARAVAWLIPNESKD